MNYASCYEFPAMRWYVAFVGVCVLLWYYLRCDNGEFISQVGGALCLLHEVREVEVVLQAGQALLAQQEDLPTTLHRDVVFAMALSYMELSREAMAEVPPAVVKSCSLLESALKVLRVGVRSI